MKTCYRTEIPYTEYTALVPTDIRDGAPIAGLAAMFIIGGAIGLIFKRRLERFYERHKRERKEYREN